MINLTRKVCILSPKISRHRIELRQDRYLSMRKLSNRVARAKDLARSKTLWVFFTYCEHFKRFHRSKLKKIKIQAKLPLVNASLCGVLAQERISLY